MRIEAFSAGKDPAAPELNEDCLVLMPGRGYAVIDGVTDRTGARYGGETSGRIAAGLIQAALEAMLADRRSAAFETKALLDRLSAEIAGAYRRHGLGETPLTDHKLRFGATLALYRHRDDHDELVLVGDSGIRLDGSRLLQTHKPLDDITAALRVAAWRALEARIADPVQINRIARQVVFHGADQPASTLEGVLDAPDLAAIARTAVARSAARFPRVPLPAIQALIKGGITNGQFVHQNSGTSSLGYSCIDGFAIPECRVTVRTVATGAVRSVELFTDGYFEPGDGFGVAAWERAADEVERIDPFKIERYPSVKGSSNGVRTDDRTYAGIVMP